MELKNLNRAWTLSPLLTALTAPPLALPPQANSLPHQEA